MLICCTIITDDSFLQTFGGVSVNSLNTILDSNQSENDENEHTQLIRHSSYYDREKFENHIQSHLKCFSILGTNIQGIGAKFNELRIFIEKIREKYNFRFSVICLQECQFKDSKKDNYFK